jgi:hypothetical protein
MNAGLWNMRSAVAAGPRPVVTRCLLPALALLLAGCGGAGSWTKSGADAAATASEYQDCRAIAASAIKTDADIDQDILATRQEDWQRSGTGRVATQTTQDHTRDREAAVVSACMRAKGFAEAR